MNEGQKKASQEDLWRINNYILLKDYLDRTISRIAARCVRSGNIAIEEYPFYGYILDVLDEICETGDYLLSKKYLTPYIEEKIKGGVSMFKKSLAEYKQELDHNSSPAMIKDDADLSQAKNIFGALDFDPTEGAGMSADDVVAKLSDAHKKEMDSKKQNANKDNK